MKIRSDIIKNLLYFICIHRSNVIIHVYKCIYLKARSGNLDKDSKLSSTSHFILQAII